MKKRKYIAMLMVALIRAVSCGVSVSSCGTMHSYWGVENDYYTDFDGHGHHKKHKKHKKYKKYKKHHKKHHHDDDDD